MTKPLACRTCGKFYCARCLFHINSSGDMDEVYAFIDEMQEGGEKWSCFHCTGTCACQDQALVAKYRHDAKTAYMCHKHRGWVGVNGGFTAAERKPQESLLAPSARRVKRKLVDADGRSDDGRDAQPPADDGVRPTEVSSQGRASGANIGREGDGASAEAAANNCGSDSSEAETDAEDNSGKGEAATTPVAYVAGEGRPKRSRRAPAALAPPALAVGAKVRKKFGAHWYCGTVTELWFNSSEGQLNAHVVYTDGDVEDISADKAGAVLVT